MKIKGIRFKILNYITGLIPKKKNLILCTSWFGERYSDSTKYVFEYLLSNRSYDIYWYASNKELYESLRNSGIPVVYSKSLRGYLYQMRANMLISSVQFDDYNPYFINGCIYLDLQHGFPGKPGGVLTPGISQNIVEQHNSYLKNTDFYQIASSRFCAERWQACFLTPFDHLIFANLPRIDVLFDKELQNLNANDIQLLKQGRKAFVYLPTHRSNGRKTLPIHNILDLKKIQSLCEEYNAVFIIKKHYYHKHESEDLCQFPNIIDLTQKEIDTQILLSQTDVLITDFSSCYIDYLALDKPIIFYAYDYEDYMKVERDYYWKYNKITAGYTTKSRSELNQAIESICHDWDDSLHKEGRHEMRDIYYDPNLEMGTTREKIANVIDELLNGTYVPHNWNIK